MFPFNYNSIKKLMDIFFHFTIMLSLYFLHFDIRNLIVMHIMQLIVREIIKTDKLDLCCKDWHYMYYMVTLMRSM